MAPVGRVEDLVLVLGAGAAGAVGLPAQERDLPILASGFGIAHGHRVPLRPRGLAVLAERAPMLGAALRQGAANTCLVLDGTIVTTDGV